jgi:hypothetical protein
MVKNYFFLFFFVLGLCDGYKSQITNDFISLSPKYLNSIQFNYSGAIQNWVCPANVTSIKLEVFGAEGGSYVGSASGGMGGKVSCFIPVTPGSTYYLVIGGKAANSTNVAVYGNGGTGGTNPSNSNNFGRAGGGLSAFLSSATLTQSSAIVIAGGGGGASSGRNGGNGGGLSGSIGNDATRGGKGGTQLSGGASGSALDSQITSPQSGSLFTGGNGGFINSGTWNSGGGGGAGYYGGGGGAGGGNYYGSGGGGSSFTFSDAKNIVHTNGINYGNGKIIIYY